MANIKKWKSQLKDAVDYPWDSAIEPDHPTCPICGEVMDFCGHDEYGDFPYGEGYWKCDSCGFKVSKNEL